MPENTAWWDHFKTEVKANWIGITVSAVGTTIGTISLLDQLKHRSKNTTDATRQILQDIKTFAERMGGK